jgi:predicted Rossmann fold nucleotide-binding protein DprA/Smf involved in DNA uptake
MTERILAIVGYRDYHDYEQFCQIMQQLVDQHDILRNVKTVGSGGAPGVDTLAERWAKDRGFALIVHKADWNKYGKAAGPKRNQLIVETMTHMVALRSPKSRGTNNSIDLARKAKKPVYVVDLGK